MAAAKVGSGTILRCPVCLAQMSVGIGVLPQSRLTCPSCRRPFEKQEGLPLKESSPVPLSAPAAAAEGSSGTRWLIHSGITLAGIGLAFVIGTDKKGPEFLGYYAIVWAVTFFGSFLFKAAAWGSKAGVVGFFIFEGLGVARIVNGLSRGMHIFGFLILMMVAGGVFYMIRLGIESSSGGGCPVGGCSSSGCSSYSSFSSGSSCSSSSSSCGGGGGCGGGGRCGGCGGGS